MERLGLTSARGVVASLAVFPILVYLQVGTSISGWGYHGTEYDSFSPLTALVNLVFLQWPRTHMLPSAQLDHCSDNPFILSHPLHHCFPKLIDLLFIFLFSLVFPREESLKTHFRAHHCSFVASPVHLHALSHLHTIASP